MKLKENKGFTLVELLTVVAIISIVAGIGALSTRNMRLGFQIKSAALTLYSDLQMARLGAIRNGRIWRVCFDPGDTVFTSYTIGNAGGTDGDICTPDDDPTAAADPAVFRKNVDLSSESNIIFAEFFSSGNQITFNPRGTASSGNIKLSLNSAMTSGRIITVNGMTGNMSVNSY